MIAVPSGCAPGRCPSRRVGASVALAAWLVLAASCGPGDGPDAAGGETGQRAAAEVRAAWSQLHEGQRPGVDAPSAGEETTMVHDAARGRILAYGGKTAENTRSDELWVFDLATRRWSRLDPVGSRPGPREDHSFVLDTANDAVVLYGGKDGPVSNETWLLDLATSTWSDITAPGAPARQRQRAVYDAPRRRMVVFGGMDERDGLDPETRSLDLDRDGSGFGTWAVLDVGEIRPPPRREHAAALDTTRQRLLVFGGRQRTRTSFLDDLWALDLATDHWTELETSGERPPRIRQTVMGYDPQTDELTMFGGEVLMLKDTEEEEFLVNRVWSLDLVTNTWADVSPYPRAMYDHGGLFVPDLGGTLVFGGSTYASGAEHGTWLVRRR